jgi:hypothetical protein
VYKKAAGDARFKTGLGRAIPIAGMPKPRSGRVRIIMKDGVLLGDTRSAASVPAKP